MVERIYGFNVAKHLSYSFLGQEIPILILHVNFEMENL